MTAIEWTWVPDGKGGTKRGETWAPPDQLPDDEWSRLEAGGKLTDEQLAGDKPLRVGKGRAGRLLDGRTHDAFPGGDR